MAAQLSFRAFSRGAHQESTSTDKLADSPGTYKAPQSTVTLVYQAHIGRCWRNVTVLWSRNLMSHYVNVMVNSLQGEICYSCKVDLNPWLFWTKKGSKSFELEGCQVVIHWDFRSAKFSGRPEPSSDYYVAIVSDGEVVLLVGDNKKKAYRRTKARPALADSVLYHKKEIVFAKKSFSTRCKFDESNPEHDIVVESSTTGDKDPEMWISVDGIVMIQVKNLQWKFRGNQTMIINKQPVEVFWDVHDWLFSNSGQGQGLFIFKPGTPAESEDERDGSPQADNGDISDGGSTYFSTKSQTSSTHDFCLFLYAWKIE
ncbi:hypothetical protein K2173_013454 [Erythroxylum novogranatense]|uniref:DUF868 family protein n=1 Tax=Erythroxylum novogranatense TaxID=1862640 RepID=A0AAV8SAF9_9ROSI|nr:hypothetical protein K2173_013454 [Erythroxylum novogranatense]